LYLSSFPAINALPLFVFDLTIGLVLVALSEEIIFRGIAKLALKRYIKSDLLIVIISATVFSSIHWSMGAPSLVSSFFIGCFYMLSFMKTKSIYPALASHYLGNYVAFSNIIPSGVYESLHDLYSAMI